MCERTLERPRARVKKRVRPRQAKKNLDLDFLLLSSNKTMATALPLPTPAPARPWMAMYGTRVGGPAESSDEKAEEREPRPPSAPIQSGLLGDDLLALCFSHLPPPSLASAACACRAWRGAIGRTDGLWRAALTRALGPATPLRPPGVSWREVFLSAPRLRTDGLYVSRNTYIRTGIVEWRTKNPVHLVTYFRYWRFFEPPLSGGNGGASDSASASGSGSGSASFSALLADDASLPRRPDPPAKCARGAFWYRTTPDPPAKAARSLALGPHGPAPDCPRVMEGRWRLRCPPWEGRAVATPTPSPSPSSSTRTERVATVAAAMAYGNAADTEVRARLGLRSTLPGACNRLDVLDLVSHDRATGVSTDMAGGGGGGMGEETDAEEGWARGGGGGRGGGDGARRLQHQRGLATFVFIPWAEIQSSQLNLPLSQMDVFIPG